MNKTEWLGQVQEEILEPELKICDPHHHLWDYPDNRYLLEELLADLGSGHNVVATVFMECGVMYRARGPEALKPVGETEFVNRVAITCANGNDGDPRVCAAIVGFANLSLGEAVGEVLDAHRSASPRFAGIRHSTAWDPSDEVRISHTKPKQSLLLDATFRTGLAQLTSRGLPFDAWLYHPQIPELTNLARACPDQLIVFDHFGGPLGIGPYAGQRAAIFDYWKNAVAELAQCENVVAKLGGLAMPVNGFGFHRAERPATSEDLVRVTGAYYLHMIERFGPTRCMFESNFPVDKASCSYAVLWNSFKRITAGFSADEKAALYHDTAARVYGLPAGP